MSKSILLIDDKEEFKEDFKIKAQSKGYALAYGKSLEELKTILPRIHKEIVAVILDIKCLIRNDQKIEKPDFIGATLNYLNQDYPDLPRLILTGDEKALDAAKMLFNTDTEIIYKKVPNEIDKLFAKLDEYYEDFPRRILTLEEREVDSIIKKGEGKYLEFKSSFQFCTKSQTLKKSLRFEVLKNIAAFSNTDGGAVLIGVKDNGDIIGLEETDFRTKQNTIDSYKLLFDDLIESNFGNGFHKNLSDMKFYNIKGKTICYVQVQSRYHRPITISKKPKNGKAYDAFFIRRLASAKELSGEEMKEYISNHF
ncbi:ATP-binding protein [Antarcticibacterium sp. 1MA-6-2]|uniref:ATP-binding protein n=1 Tax=Antarcticibacterium sp. 1MA-6-2 TaxID=2908210 RepID=UPI001F1577D8|nr:ATP-binding protein [Antarcticibacterium sp. 1MA-6-2]UJH90124.1 ATP-binding protein [Antarcticibacterium sp. 1MA-6-2]